MIQPRLVIGACVVGGLIGIIYAANTPAKPPRTDCSTSVHDPQRDLSADASESQRDQAYEDYTNTVELCQLGR